MLESDEIIYNILQEAKKEGDEILSYFHISYPNRKLAEENNCIYIGVVSSESLTEGFIFSQYRDMTEIVITTKKIDYREALTLIKLVAKHIIHLIYMHQDMFPERPVIRTINPEYNNQMVLNRGHILIQSVSPVITDDYDTEDTVSCVKEIITREIKIE